MNRKTLNMDEAKNIAKNELSRGEDSRHNIYIITDENTIERPNCFVFFYQSALYLETGNISDYIISNSPILVDRRNGVVTRLGSRYPVDHYISEYECAKQTLTTHQNS